MHVNHAIERCRRDLRFSFVVRSLLAACALVLIILGPGLGLTSSSIVVGVGAVWVVWTVLNYRGIRATRLASVSPMLIASGEFDQAEQHIDQAIQTFSALRHVKLLALHYLAALRHAQRRWAEAALAAQAVLGLKLGRGTPIARRTWLILADASIEMGDLAAAQHAIQALYGQRLSLPEAMNLCLVQLEYQARLGQWSAMMQGIESKVQLAEIMAPAAGVKTEALLALAAARSSQPHWQQWLTRRVELLADVTELVAQAPLLAELWPSSPQGDRADNRS
jgi:tetratricopeptide (TPR) repeat protein